MVVFSFLRKRISSSTVDDVRFRGAVGIQQDSVLEDLVHDLGPGWSIRAVALAAISERWDFGKPFRTPCRAPQVAGRRADHQHGAPRLERRDPTPHAAVAYRDDVLTEQL